MGSSRVARSARGQTFRDGKREAPKVEVAEATGSATVEGRDPRKDPRVGDVLEDDESRIEVTWVGQARTPDADTLRRLLAPGERWDAEACRPLTARRHAWRRRVRGEPERAPEEHGWTVGSWVANMTAARVVTVAG